MRLMRGRGVTHDALLGEFCSAPGHLDADL